MSCALQNSKAMYSLPGSSRRSFAASSDVANSDWPRPVLPRSVKLKIASTHQSPHGRVTGMFHTCAGLREKKSTGYEVSIVGGLIRFNNSIRSAGYFSSNASETNSVLPAMAWEHASTFASPAVKSGPPPELYL